MTRALVWLRRDLRVADNPALYHAANACKQGVLGVYLISPGQWKDHDDAPCKIDFWIRNLSKLKRELEKLNIPLVIATAHRFDQAEPVLSALAIRHGCDALYFNREYEVNERRRDEVVTERLEAKDITVRSFTDRVVLEPGDVLTKANSYYRVFTPFKRRWLAVAEEQGVEALPAPPRQERLGIESSPIPKAVEGFTGLGIDPGLWPAGEVHAEERLDRFMAERIDRYHMDRDRPAIDGTSTLSPYLAAGVISPRQCLEAALEVNRGRLDSGKEGPLAWMSELIWREFYQHVLVGFPRVSMHQPFREETDRIIWNDDEERFQAWCRGRTGYPIVDAAIRQLLRTGWMHNRLRMITAMFLTKDLFMDWRRGERFFMQNLIDGDLGSNNGGWQWSASTGTDAAPYFRVLNPTRQSRKWDPDGAFLRRHLPELDELDDEVIHDPPGLPTGVRERLGYPGPIVDHAAARKLAVDRFRDALG